MTPHITTKSIPSFFSILLRFPSTPQLGTPGPVGTWGGYHIWHKKFKHSICTNWSQIPSFVIVYDQKCDWLILFIKKVYNIGTNLNIIRLWYQYQFNEIISSGTERDTE